jgi:hypothetical protein
MPVIFVKIKFNIIYLNKDIKCFVILFSNFFFILVVNVYLAYFGVSSFYQPCLLVLKSKFNNSKIITSNSITVRRYYSTYIKKAGLKDILEKKSYRKTLSSPESRPYVNLYKGRGVPKNEPTWVKDNGKERSPFGASWAKDKKDRLPFPTKYPCNYRNIMDPYNNRESIKEVCKGNRVVYIWTYLPTGVCLVGSSSNSVERVLSYFERKYLFLDKRRGVQFLANYGFKDIQLTIIYYNNIKFTMRDIKIIEAYYINELNSNLNSQKYVYLPPEPLESVLPFINITNRDTAVPIFVYGPDLTRVLYIFNSKTSIYNDFNIHWNTLVKYIDNIDKKYYDYFIFSTKILEGSDFDCLLSLNELMDLKQSLDPQIPHRSQKVRLKDLTENTEYEFYSLSQVAAFIKEMVGVCDRVTMGSHMKNNTIYKKRWKIEKM